MRLIHYSKIPLLKVESRPHEQHGAGAYKTPGLWVSVEGDDDWVAWCRSEQWSLTSFAHAAEIILHQQAAIKYLSSAKDIDLFTEEFRDDARPVSGTVDWLAIRQNWQGLVIAPYCWERRLTNHTNWYYGWDCASGVIWDANAIAELRATTPPEMLEAAA